MPITSVLILRGPGTNCDAEMSFAFKRAGAQVRTTHINHFRDMPQRLHDYQILAIPGGFSHGDDVAAGKILATQLDGFLADAVREFRDAGKLILGVCNGFQVLLKAGLLVPSDDDGPLATLAHNESGRFVDQWTELAVTPGNCPFLTGIERMVAPVAHGEGRFVCRREWILEGLAQTNQIVLRYAQPGLAVVGATYNPNGSQDDVAGLCDASGRVFGLMPHPERSILPTQHPQWTRAGLAAEGDGMQIFRNAVEFFTAS